MIKKKLDILFFLFQINKIFLFLIILFLKM